MQHPVPQFIEIEDKVIGPLTIKQFIYLLVGAGVLFILKQISSLPLFILEVLVIGGFFAALAFLKFNDRPMIYAVFSLVTFFKDPTFRVWNRSPEIRRSSIRTKKDKDKKKDTYRGTSGERKEFSRGDLKKLVTILDTAGQMGQETELGENIEGSLEKNF